ncbi:hypothetical protein OH77DRAFT_1549171 [Trametes cingulata]|nr:hypothetical protein OH77DRAFT_1549171 [Trametes cingulata]
MRIDGSTRARTQLDDDSGAVLLRRLHPRIASYNDLVIFLMKSNMDIKFIGSGEAAKALIHYVTDYITKPSLPAHAGLSALSYAIQKTNEKFAHMTEDNAEKRSRGALTLAVNRMLSRQEMSHQQVMSYLVGGGDKYASHTFRVLYWGSFDRIFRKAFPDGRDNVGEEDAAEDQTGREEVPGGGSVESVESYTLRLQPDKSISATNQQQDYIYRSIEGNFDAMCLYEFVGKVEKGRLAGRRSTARSTDTDVGAHGLQGDVDDGAGRERRRGRRPMPRGAFSSDQHTQYETHNLRERTEWTIPVILGDRVPRSDRGEEERNAWARMMLILFVPWRRPSDVRSGDETWTQAFERQRHRISDAHLKIIANMNVLSECRDVRDAFQAARRAEAIAMMCGGLPARNDHTHSGEGDESAEQTYQLFESPDLHDAFRNTGELSESQCQLDHKVGSRTRELLDMCYGNGDHGGAASGSGSQDDSRTLPQNSQVAEDQTALLHQREVMRNLKRKRRPEFADEEGDMRPARRRRMGRGNIDENVTL